MPHDSPLPRVNTLGSDEGSMTLQELMVFYTTLSKKVESLETNLKKTKLIYGSAYTKLSKKVKKLENKVMSNQARRRTKTIVFDDEEDLEDPSKQGRMIAEIDQDPTISLVQHDAEIQGRHEHDMEFDFDLDIAKDVSTAKPVSTSGVVVTTASSVAKDKAAVRLQAKLKEEERQRIARAYKAASSFNVKEREDIQARVEADKELAQRLQAEEREIYIEAEQARMLLRGYSFNEIKTLFDTTIRRVNTFFPIESEVDRAVLELAAGSSKRDAEEELDQESSKRQKTAKSSELAKEPKDKEEELSQEELQQIMIIVPEQGMNVKALQTKYLIIDWEIYTEGTRKYWKIIRVRNHTEVHQFFNDMLKALDRDDLVMLWSLFKENFKSIKPTNDKEREIWVELKRLFKPDTDDEEGNRHLHTGREGVSIIKGNSYIDAGRKYWKIIRVRNHTEVHQFFDDMLKALDRDDLVMLWSLFKENFLGRYSCRLKDQEDEVFGRILSENNV
ncbi:hypothetical protein Tco_1055118 [Tanacetum coccineum]|uniref:Uncharacterized protein n=1 Tax=Tanacetum coccineum TaxID=301880 RepID=A0ABQ5GYQ0_9ASTR